MPLSAEETLALVDAWTAPLSLAAPSGVSAKEDARHLAVTAGVARLDAVADEPIDWQAAWGTVITQGGGLLREKSKDIAIASMAAHALLRRDHLEGLLVGVALLTALIERSWPTLFLELRRIKGRAAAVQWFLDASEAHLRAYTPASSVSPAREGSAFSARTSGSPAPRPSRQGERSTVKRTPGASPCSWKPVA